MASVKTIGLTNHFCFASINQYRIQPQNYHFYLLWSYKKKNTTILAFLTTCQIHMGRPHSTKSHTTPFLYSLLCLFSIYNPQYGREIPRDYIFEKEP